MIDQNEEDYLVEAEEFEVEEDSDEKRGCFRTVALVIIILLLLLLFWPVKSDEKSIADSRSNDTNRETTGESVVGDARYTVLEAEPVFDEIGGRKQSNYKATVLSVRFKVENIATVSRTLDFSMVEVRDQFGNNFVPNPRITELWYEDKDKRSPWGEEVDGKGSKKATVFFYVYVSPAKKYSLLGRDFDWRDNQFVAIEMGTIDALPKR